MPERPHRKRKESRKKFQVWLDPQIRPYEQATLDTLNDIRRRNPDVTDRDILGWLVSVYRGETIQPVTTEARLFHKLNQMERKIEAANAQLLAQLIDVIGQLDLSLYVREDGRSMHDEIGNLIPDSAYENTFQGVYGATFDDDD